MHALLTCDFTCVLIGCLHWFISHGTKGCNGGEIERICSVYVMLF